MSTPTAIRQTTPTSTPLNSDTARLVAQLALSATWLHLDGTRPTPVDAAVEVLEGDVDGALVAQTRTAVDGAAGDLDWTEQVAYALHLLLTAEATTTLAA